MYKRFRKARGQISIAENSSSSDTDIADLETSKIIVRSRPANLQKYVRVQRSNAPNATISDTSSDELNSQEQENRRCLLNPNRSRGSAKALQLTPTNKFQPLSVSVSAKKMSPQPSETYNMAKPIPGTPPSTCQTPWHSLRKTLSTLRPDRRAVLQRSILDCSNQSAEDTFVDCSPALSLDASLRTLIDKQQMPSKGKLIASAPKRQRCLKGGYLQEFKRLMQKERMDRRSLNHNQRLGISPGYRVQVLGICESFGVHMARVQTVDGDVTIFNVIVVASIAHKVCVGSSLELYFDLNVVNALQLPNKELVYIQPNKLVLL